MIVYRESSADPLTLAYLCWESVPKYFRHLSKVHHSWPSFTLLLSPFNELINIKLEIIFVFLLAILFTLLRYRLQLESKKWMIDWKVFPHYSHKLPECIWKLAYYGLAWGFSVYVHFFTSINTFHDPLSMWKGWKIDPLVEDAPRCDINILIIYATQTAFYIHSIYATLFMDQWRSDSWVMFIHHFIAIILLTLSYIENYTLAGALVLFLQDSSDAALEITKLCVYLKKRKDGRYFRWLDKTANGVLYSFALIWVVFRLWYYSSKLLYGAIYGGTILGPRDSFAFPTLGLLLFSILILNLFWFNFILRMCIRVWRTGEEPEDNREYDNISEEKKKGYDITLKKE
ncbi:lagr-1 [Pristionchus pacificus]|nr:lagr-1 [Pristionchus pacificus]